MRRTRCDPDQPYYRGPGWYRTRLVLQNPFAEGRTILHFQGAGQTTTLWIGSTLIGTHKGGYDEFVFDITDAILKLPGNEALAGVPIAVLCDNSLRIWIGFPPTSATSACMAGSTAM